MTLKTIVLITSLALSPVLYAQAPSAVSTSGTLVVVPATGEVTHANDQAIAMLMIEEQDKDKKVAAARVNQKMKQGVDLVRRADPSAQLKTQGYYTYAVYPEEPPRPMSTAPVRRVPTAWRVGQYLEVKTQNLDNLPKTVASAQSVLALASIQFGLSPAVTSKLDDQRIAATYRNLNERIASIARAMGRNPSDAVIDVVDFEGSGNYAGQQDRMMMSAAPAMRGKMSDDVPEPSFEPGETTLQMRLVGKVKFK